MSSVTVARPKPIDPLDPDRWPADLRERVEALQRADEAREVELRRETQASRIGACSAARAACRRVFGPQYCPSVPGDYTVEEVKMPSSLETRWRYRLSPFMLGAIAAKEAGQDTNNY